MTLSAIETPALILDRDRLKANCERMARRLAGSGVTLRPHMKTLKSADAAHLAIELGAEGITVATLREADYFLQRNIADLTYAVCITPNKFDHANALVGAGADLKLLTDSPEAASTLVKYCDQKGVRFKVLIEIDSGEHRTGMVPGDDRVVETAQILDQGRQTECAGVLTHAGHSYRCRSAAELRAVAEEERLAIIKAANAIRDAGIACPVVSLGSTPTAIFGETFDGVTEIRAGVYMAGDLFQAVLGTCEFNDIAITVLSSVMSRDADGGSAVIDAGGLALSKDRSTSSTDQDFGFGLLADIKGRIFEPTECVGDVHQEHGAIQIVSPDNSEKLHMGSMVRVLPNHVCMTAGIYDRYYVVEGQGQEIVAIWDKCMGW